MAKTIYVGNLVWEATMDDLFTLFREHGDVTQAQVIMDRDTGRSRGFGFVVMNNDAEAQQAIEALNGFDYKGRPLTVNEARPREKVGGGGPGNYGGILTSARVALVDVTRNVNAARLAAKLLLRNMNPHDRLVIHHRQPQRRLRATRQIG